MGTVYSKPGVQSLVPKPPFTEVAGRLKLRGMKILVIGATGTIGRAIVGALEPRHTIIGASRESKEHPVDIADARSVEALFAKVGTVDAIVSASGAVHFGPLVEMTSEQFRVGLESKVLGQVNVALVGQHHLADRGSITLTSGSVAFAPVPGGANASTANAALHGFVLGAAVELRKDRRINVVSPTILRESVDLYGAAFRGIEPVSAARVAQAYVRSVEGAQTGQIFRVD